MSEFSRCLEFTHAAEGGFVDHPNDLGGPTKYGFSLRFLKRIVFDGDGDGDTDREDVLLLSRDQAALLYRIHFWEPIRAQWLPWPLCLIAFDAAVHHGPGRSVRFLQEAVNIQQEAVNIQAGELLQVDGLMGPKTFQGLTGVDREQLAADMLELRRRFMRRIVERDPSQEVFLIGWLKRVDKLEEVIGKGWESEGVNN